MRRSRQCAASICGVAPRGWRRRSGSVTPTVRPALLATNRQSCAKRVWACGSFCAGLRSCVRLPQLRRARAAIGVGPQIAARCIACAECVEPFFANARHAGIASAALLVDQARSDAVRLLVVHARKVDRRHCVACARGRAQARAPRQRGQWYGERQNPARHSMPCKSHRKSVRFHVRHTARP